MPIYVKKNIVTDKILKEAQMSWVAADILNSEMENADYVWELKNPPENPGIITPDVKPTDKKEGPKRTPPPVYETVKTEEDKKSKLHKVAGYDVPQLNADELLDQMINKINGGSADNK